MTQTDDLHSGTPIEGDLRPSFCGEDTFAGKTGRSAWLADAAFQADSFRTVQFSGFNYSYTVPALFAQVEQDALNDLTLAASARWDAHSEYGSRVSPRLSLLYKPSRWTVRASVGHGFYAPTPFVEEIEETGLSRLEPLGKLRARSEEHTSELQSLMSISYAVF